MIRLNAYLAFDGNCEEAMNFYKDLFKGEIRTMQRFGESTMEVAEQDKEKILHSVLDFDGMLLMASDSMPGKPPVMGSNITLCLNLKDVTRAERIFERLAEGGNVQMQLQETFWNSLYGMLIDRFGIPWMVNCELPKKK